MLLHVKHLSTTLTLIALVITILPIGHVSAQVPPDFTVSTSQSEISIPLGGSGNVQIIIDDVDPLNGFAESVQLIVTGIPSSTAGALSPSTATPPFPEPISGRPILTISPSATATPGRYDLTITGTSGSVQHSTTLTLYISDFEMFASESVISARQGEIRDFTLTIQSASDTRFAGTVTLQSNPTEIDGVDVSILPSSISIPQGGSSQATVRLTVSDTANIKTHAINIIGTVTGTAPSLEHMITITVLVVTNPLFVDVQANPSPAILFQESSIIVTVTDIDGSAVTGVFVTLTATTGSGKFSNGDTTTSGLTDGTGRYISGFTPTSSVQITIIADAIKQPFSAASKSLSLNVHGDFQIIATPRVSTIDVDSISSITVTIKSIDGFSAPVTLSVSPSVPGMTMRFVSPTLTPPPNGEVRTTLEVTLSHTTQYGTYSLAITGISDSLSKTEQFTVYVPVKEFSINIEPKERIISQGESTTYNITITPRGGFSGQVALAINDLPNDISASFTPKIVPVVPGSARSSILTIETNQFTQPRTSYPIIIEASYIGSKIPIQASLTILELFDVLVDSSPRVSPVIVDGTVFQPEELPKTFRWVQGQMHTISVPVSTISDIPGSRYTFSAWSDANTDLSRTVIAGVSTTFRADFRKEFLLSLRSEPVGVMEPIGGGWYDEGSTTTINAEDVIMLSSDIRYRFVGWTGASLSQDNNIVIVMEGSKTVIANYAIQYLLQTGSEPVGVVQIPGGGSWHDLGAKIELSATGRVQDYVFSRWDLNGESNTDNPIVIVVEGPIAITAQYALLPRVGILWINVTDSQAVFEGESSYAWVTLSNTIDRSGEITVIAKSRFPGLTITPESQTVTFLPGQVLRVGFELNHISSGFGSFEIIIEETAGGPDSISSDLRIFPEIDRDRINAVGKAVAVKILPTQDILMVPDDRVRIFAESILVASGVDVDSPDLEKAKAILDFVINHSQFSSNPNTVTTPRSVTEMVIELQDSGGVSSTYRIPGDSKTFQVLYGGLMRSLSFDVRPVIGVMESSPLRESPFILLHSWIEVRIGENWVHVDPLLGVINGDGKTLPFNLKPLLTDAKFLYEIMPNWGGVLAVVAFEEQPVDITQDYKMIPVERLQGSLIFSEGNVEISVLAISNKIASGVPIAHLWTPSDPTSTEIRTFAPLGEAILLSSGVDVNFISIIVDGEVGTDYTINVMSISDIRPIVSSMDSFLIASSSTEHKIDSIPTGVGRSMFVISQIQSLKYLSDYIVEFSSNSTILENNALHKMNALRVVISGRDGTTGTLNVTIPKTLINEVNSSMERVFVLLDDQIVEPDIIDSGMFIVITIHYDHSQSEILIYLKTFNLELDVRDPFNQIIMDADLTINGPFRNETKISSDSSFAKLVPGDYVFTVRYRGESQEITRSVTDSDQIASLNLFRSDSMVAVIATAILGMIGGVAIIVQAGLSRVIPRVKDV